MTPAIGCSPVSTAPAINPCPGFSVIASVVDTVDKFIVGDGDNDTGEQLLSVTKTLAISLFLVAMTPVIRVWGMSMDESFHGSSN
jgi:hypothetical protein